MRDEALAAGRRRALARQTGNTNHNGRPYGAYNWSERFRQLADELDAIETVERRREALERLSTPSDLIARAKADWPNQAETVVAYAKANRIGLGEAWRRTIAAGVAALRKERGE